MFETMSAAVVNPAVMFNAYSHTVSPGFILGSRRQRPEALDQAVSERYQSAARFSPCHRCLPQNFDADQ